MDALTTVRALLSPVLVVLIAAACAAPAPGRPAETPWAVHSVPNSTGASLDGVAWLGDSLVVSRSGGLDGGDIVTPTRPVLVDPEKGVMSAIDDKGPACDGRIDENAMTKAPDGRVHWVWRCFGLGSTRSYRLMALAAAGGTPVAEAEFRSGPTLHHLAVGSGDKPLFLVSLGSRICESIANVHDNAVVPISASVDGPEGSFRLDDPRVLDDCAAVGRALSPAISSTGRIAFLAATSAAGTGGPARLDRPPFLYLMDSVGGPAVRQDLAVFDASLAWSPDGSRLLVSGRIANDEGTWLLDPSTHQLTRIAAFAFGSPSWTADGSRIAGERGVGDPMAMRGELIILTPGS
jgi:hypothetical protein